MPAISEKKRIQNIYKKMIATPGKNNRQLIHLEFENSNLHKRHNNTTKSLFLSGHSEVWYTYSFGVNRGSKPSHISEDVPKKCLRALETSLFS